MTSTGHPDYVQHETTPLNACSLESLPHPIEVSQGLVWPMMLGCYQLDETTGQRQGHLDLYAIPVPEDNDNSCVQGLGKPPLTVLGGKPGKSVSGILDGKWSPRKINNKPIVYATAHASGEIRLHQVTASSDTEFPLQSRLLATSETDKETSTASSEGLCLALSWDFGRSNDGDTSTVDSQRVISSYSDGQVAIHDIYYCRASSSGNANDNRLSAQLDLAESWPAHKMFRSPAEVWAASFTTQRDVVLTGGDEGKLKIWDLRAGTSRSRPVQTISDTFEAGVTVLSPHPRREHWIACGSYDETMAVLDLRNVSSSQAPRLLFHSDSLGGGMWRIKWHPYNDTRLLLGAMHGGCRVVDLMPNNHEEKSSWRLKIHQEFTQHKSMAYGADWLVHRNPARQSRQVYAEAAASCSFYDSALYLWNVNK